MNNSYLDRKTKTRIGESGRLSEKHTVRRLNMKPTIASGSTDLERADMKSDEFLVEAKSTVNASLGVKLDWLISIADEATTLGKEPALTVTFVNNQGRPQRRGRWVLVEEDLFRRTFPASIQGENQ